MDGLKDKLKSLGKYKYVLFVILIGVVLMLLPNKTIRKSEPAETTISEVNEEERIQNILQMVHGAGRVAVYLKTERSEQYIYQTDNDTSSTTDRNDQSKDTVLVTDSERNQSGLIQTVLTPKYAGAVIVCDGADDAYVKLSIVDAVSKATGLGSDKISVLKMK